MGRTNLRHHINIPDGTPPRPTMRTNWLRRLVRLSPVAHLQVLRLTATAHRVSTSIARTPHVVAENPPPAGMRLGANYTTGAQCITHANACDGPGKSYSLQPCPSTSPTGILTSPEQLRERKVMLRLIATYHPRPRFEASRRLYCLYRTLSQVAVTTAGPPPHGYSCTIAVKSAPDSQSSIISARFKALTRVSGIFAQHSLNTIRAIARTYCAQHDDDSGSGMMVDGGEA
jgi:hypothetical protein